jgi:RNA polymerase sigma-70 factor, ECF subfamily
MTAIEFQYNLVNLEKNLMRFAYSLTENKNDAKDLVQETFLKALLHCNKFDYESNLKAWTFTIMKNTFINHYRFSSMHNPTSNQINEKNIVKYSLSSVAEIPDSIYRSKEIEETIEGLDVKYRVPFKMHHEGFKYKEIAKTLHLHVGTIKSRIFFARKKLINQLKEQ